MGLSLERLSGLRSRSPFEGIMLAPTDSKKEYESQGVICTELHTASPTPCWYLPPQRDRVAAEKIQVGKMLGKEFELLSQISGGPSISETIFSLLAMYHLTLCKDSHSINSVENVLAATTIFHPMILWMDAKSCTS